MNDTDPDRTGNTAEPQPRWWQIIRRWRAWRQRRHLETPPPPLRRTQLQPHVGPVPPGGIVHPYGANRAQRRAEFAIHSTRQQRMALRSLKRIEQLDKVRKQQHQKAMMLQWKRQREADSDG